MLKYPVEVEVYTNSIRGVLISATFIVLKSFINGPPPRFLVYQYFSIFLVHCYFGP